MSKGLGHALHLTFGGMWRWRRVAVARRAPHRTQWRSGCFCTRGAV